MESHLSLRVFDRPVDIDYARRTIHRLPNFPREIDLALIVRTVNLGHERLEHGRTRRHLGHLDPGGIF
jgi:hypothetical protein